MIRKIIERKVFESKIDIKGYLSSSVSDTPTPL